MKFSHYKMLKTDLEQMADDIENESLRLTIAIEEKNLAEAKNVALKVLSETLAFYLRLSKEEQGTEHGPAVVAAAKGLTASHRSKKAA